MKKLEDYDKGPWELHHSAGGLLIGLTNDEGTYLNLSGVFGVEPTYREYCVALMEKLNERV